MCVYNYCSGHVVKKGHLKAKSHAEIWVYKSSQFVHDPKSDYFHVGNGRKKKIAQC